MRTRPIQRTPADANEHVSNLRQDALSSHGLICDEKSDFPEGSTPKATDGSQHRTLIYVDNANTPSATGIPFQTIENMIQASAHAYAIGRPLLHHLTIRWGSGDWSWHQPLQNTLTKWLSRKSGGAYYIWVKEGNSKPHSHFLLHL